MGIPLCCSSKSCISPFCTDYKLMADNTLFWPIPYRPYSDDVTNIIIGASAILSCKEFHCEHSTMVKSCCAPGCENRWFKGTALSFYRFPSDQKKRAMWVAAVKRERWEPTEHSWLCSAHFVSGSKSKDPLSPDYVPSIFSHVRSPGKRKAEQDIHSYTRRKEVRSCK